MQVPGAQHTSCTVEMASFHERLDVAVVDEVGAGGQQGGRLMLLVSSACIECLY